VLPGVAELTGHALPGDELAKRWAVTLTRRLVLVLQSSSWTDSEHAEISRISDERYSTPDWNERR
jgi:hypothetical protein